MQVAIKFDVQTRGVGSRKEMSCKIGGVEVFGKTTAEVKERLAVALLEACTPPTVVVVRNKDTFRVLVGDCGTVEVLKPVDNDAMGRMMMTCTSYGSGDAVDEADRLAMHLAQQEWERGMPMPNYVPQHLVSDFEAWTRFQEAYFVARQSGCSEPMCHELACDAMSV